MVMYRWWFNALIFMNKNKKNLGFTLVELLIVIAIIGIISTVATVSLNEARAKARDAKRLSDMAQITKALELYYTEYGEYPNPQCHDLAAIGGCNSITYNGPGINYSSWIHDLTDNMGVEIPNDPINNAEGLDPDDYYTGLPMVYIFTRAGSRSADYSNYYYLLFRLETGDQIDTCGGSYAGNPWGPTWSCIGGGNLP